LIIKNHSDHKMWTWRKDRRRVVYVSQ